MDFPVSSPPAALRGKTVVIVGDDRASRTYAERLLSAGVRATFGNGADVSSAVATADVVLLVGADAHRGRFYLRAIHEHLRSGAYLGILDSSALRAKNVNPPRSVNLFTFVATPHGQAVVVKHDPAGDTHEVARAIAVTSGLGDATFAALGVAARAFVAACHDALVAGGYSAETAEAACAHELRGALAAIGAPRDAGRAVAIACGDLRTSVQALMFETQSGGALTSRLDPDEHELRFRVC